jgi:regulator of cell morphogenesis and NO signaling
MLQAHAKLPDREDFSDDHWRTIGDMELIEYILAHFHDRHRDQLPELIRLSKRVELMHGGHVQCPAGLTRLLEEFQQGFEAHMRKEEEILFPLIARGVGTAAQRPVNVMRGDHTSHLSEIAEIQRVTRDFVLPESACGTWHALYRELARFIDDLQRHIHLENEILFARIDAANEETHHG